MKNTLIFALALLCAGVSAAAPTGNKVKKPTQETQPTTPNLSTEDVQNQKAYLDHLALQLSECSASYKKETAAISGLLALKLMEAEGDAGRFGLTSVQRAQIENEVIESRMKSPTYRKCEKDAMAEFNDSSAKFVRKFVESRHREKATEALAIWMSAINNIGKETFAAEEAKFQTVANMLKLELSI